MKIQQLYISECNHPINLAWKAFLKEQPKKSLLQNSCVWPKCLTTNDQKYLLLKISIPH